jgi:hypothetical protein
MLQATMVWIFFFALLCLTAPLSAQAVPADPAYFPDFSSRMHNYVFRTYTDPVRVGWLLVDSAMDTAWKAPNQWDRSPESYSYRVASGWGRRIVKNTLQLSFETALQEDSRYRLSGEHGFGKRVWFAINRSVLAYKPNGSLEPAYGRIAAGVATAAISSTWHPQSVNAATLLSGAGQSALDRAGNNLLTEFEPDLIHLGRKTWKTLRRK